VLAGDIGGCEFSPFLEKHISAISFIFVFGSAVDKVV